MAGIVDGEPMDPFLMFIFFAAITVAQYVKFGFSWGFYLSGIVAALVAILMVWQWRENDDLGQVHQAG